MHDVEVGDKYVICHTCDLVLCMWNYPTLQDWAVAVEEFLYVHEEAMHEGADNRES